MKPMPFVRFCWNVPISRASAAPADAGEQVGDDDRHGPRAVDADATAVGGLGVLADGPDVEPEAGAVDHRASNGTSSTAA